MRHRHWLYTIILFVGLLQPVVAEEPLSIAAASSLRPTLDHIAERYRNLYPSHEVRIVYGSSGRLSTQILNGAPFDLFLSANMEYPRYLHQQDTRTSEPEVYASGRLVLWSARLDASRLQLADLANNDIRRIAIAQPATAPYGERAREALMAAGVWQAVEQKLVYGENISQVATMVTAGAADVALLALSLAVQPALAGQAYGLIDDKLHEPLLQGMVITARGRDNPQAETFMAFMREQQAREVLMQEGFQVPPGRQGRE